MLEFKSNLMRLILIFGLRKYQIIGSLDAIFLPTHCIAIFKTINHLSSVDIISD